MSSPNSSSVYFKELLYSRYWSLYSLLSYFNVSFPDHHPVLGSIHLVPFYARSKDTFGHLPYGFPPSSSIHKSFMFEAISRLGALHLLLHPLHQSTNLFWPTFICIAPSWTVSCSNRVTFTGREMGGGRGCSNTFDHRLRSRDLCNTISDSFDQSSNCSLKF